MEGLGKNEEEEGVELASTHVTGAENRKETGAVENQKNVQGVQNGVRVQRENCCPVKNSQIRYLAKNVCLHRGACNHSHLRSCGGNKNYYSWLLR